MLNQGLRDLLVDQRLADLSQYPADSRSFGLGQRLQGAPDAAVIGPTCLLPGGGHRLILFQRAASPADVF